MVCNSLVDFDPFCVFALVVNFRVRLFLKRALSFTAQCLVDREDLCFDILLCDVHFHGLGLKLFLPS